MSSSSEITVQGVSGTAVRLLVVSWLTSRGGVFLILPLVLFTGPASWPVRIVVVTLAALVGVGVVRVSRSLVRRASWEIPGGMVTLRRSSAIHVAVAGADAVVAVGVVVFTRYGPLADPWPVTVLYPGTTVILATGIAALGLGFVRVRAARRVRLAPWSVIMGAVCHLTGAGYAFWEAVRRGPLDWLPGQLLAVPLMLAFVIVLHLTATRLESRRART